MFKLFVAFFAMVMVASSLEEETVDRRHSNADLIAVVQVHRHGQRVPVAFYANDPYSDSSYWPAAGGQLTNTGKFQHWSLGRFTRRRYDGFLPQQYDPDQFYAQTTDMDRTFMSALSNMAGIFPPRGPEVWNRFVLWQPIPLRVANTSIISSMPDCDIYSTETSSVLTDADEFKQINEEYADLYAYLTEQSGTNVTSVSGVDSIFDPVSIEIQFGFKQPDWVANVYPQPITKLAGYYFWAHSYTDTQKRLTAGSWLYTVFDYFSNMWDDSSYSKKYQLYSAHDFNIAAILNTLGDYQKQVPGFASTVYFELRNKSGNAVLNIWYRDNGVLQPITINGCSFDCTLADAQSILSPWLVDIATWKSECAATKTTLSDLTKTRNDPAFQKNLNDVRRNHEAILGKKTHTKAKK